MMCFLLINSTVHEWIVGKSVSGQNAIMLVSLVCFNTLKCRRQDCVFVFLVYSVDFIKCVRFQFFSRPALYQPLQLCPASCVSPSQSRLISSLVLLVFESSVQFSLCQVVCSVCLILCHSLLFSVSSFTFDPFCLPSPAFGNPYFSLFMSIKLHYKVTK